MTTNWNARLYLLEFSHRWSLAILAFLIGCLVGFFVSIIIPTSFFAETTLLVTYNADAIFRNPEDYKNWHMGELDALIVAPDVVQETHERLRKIDPYWESVSTEELTQSFDVQWRNTGTWRLVAKSNTAQHATQALETWRDVFLETYQRASSAAFDMLILSDQVSNLSREMADAKTRYSVLIGTRDSMQAWRDVFTKLAQDRIVDTSTRWKLKSLAAHAAGYDPAWGSLLERFPSPDAFAVEYVIWLEEALAYLETGIEALDAKITSDEAELAELEIQYQTAIDDSRGLSSMVHVEKVTNSSPIIKSSRNTGLAALVGGLIGLIAWFVFGLIRISLKSFK